MIMIDVSRSLLLGALLSSFLLLSVSGHLEPHPLSIIQLQNIKTKLDGGVIRIEAPIIYGMGETVNITFSNMSSHHPGNSDWIGVWFSQAGQLLYRLAV